jgi:Protein of unknown function (DUF3014)
MPSGARVWCGHNSIGLEALMEQWSVRDDRPYSPHVSEAHQAHSAYVWWILFLILLAGAGGAAYYFWAQPDLFKGGTPAEAAPPSAPPPAVTAAAPQPAEAAPAPSAEPAAPLPSLDNSDPMMRETVSGLITRKAFETMVYPTQLVRRIVATVDNLPRETAPRRVMPLEPVPGHFGVAAAGEGFTLAASNAERYAPYVRVFQTLDPRALAKRYFDSYALFQRAYAELGFPNQRFHDRLLEAIDNLLEAPQLAAPVKLERPKVLYVFADPELESLSAGQKIMVRMGPENAAKVKAKLREIRRELTAQRTR